MIGRRVRGPTLVSSCATGRRCTCAPIRRRTRRPSSRCSATAHLLIAVTDDQCVEPALSVAAGDSHYLAASPWS
jgi:hypothetical protein